jgi:hypothetical protein
MDLLRERLELPEKTSADWSFYICDLTVRAWGRELRFAAIARNGKSDIPFVLTFTDCREIRWRTYAHIEGEQITHIGGFVPGRSEHRSPAHLLTDSFGLTLTYREIIIERGV